MQSGNDEAVVSLVIDASGLRQGSTEAVALGKRLIDSFKAVETAAKAVGNVVSSSGAQIVESTSSTSRFLDQLERKLNPLGVAANKAKEEMERLIRIMGGTNVEAAQRASVALELQAKKVLELKNAIVLASGENKRLEATYESLNRAFQNAVGSLGNLIAKYQPASASAKQMTSELASLNAAYKAGLIVEENYVAMNAKIINSYNEGEVAAQKLAESRARLIAQGRADQNVQTAQTGIMQVTGQQAGTDFSRDLRLQMEKDNELLMFEKQIDNEILNSRKQRLAQEVLARKSATDVMIADLKRLQIEETKANTDRFKYQEQMAPKSNVAQHTQDVAEQQQDVAKAAKEAADRIDYLSTRFNQDAVAAKNYRQTISDLNEAFNKGLVGHRELGIETGKAIDQYNKSTVAGQAAAKAHRGLADDIHKTGLNTRVAQYAMTNFSFQVNDVVSGLAMGQQPFRIFAQQAGQFVQIFQQIGRENIGQFFKDMGKDITNFGGAIGRWLITPMGAAVTGLAALGIGAALVIGKILEAETRVRSFGVILRTMGTDGLTSAKELDEVVKKLRDTGSAAKDAQDAVNAIARTPGINPSRVGDISDTARNISAARGISLPDAASGLANAIAGGADELTKYAQSLAIKFNPEEEKAIKLAILHRDKLNELRTTYSAIVRVMRGEYDNSLSQTQRLVAAFTEQYNKLLDAIGNTEVFQESMRRLTRLGEIITAAVKGNLEFDIKFTFKFFSDMGVNIPVAEIRNWLKTNVTPSEETAAANKQLFQARRNAAGTSSGVVIAGSTISALDASTLGEPGSVATILPKTFSAIDEASAKAIRRIESGSAEGNYSALGPVTKTGDRAYGAYQVMGNNVPSWTSEYYGQRLTPDQFLGNKTAQDSVFAGQFGKYTNKYGVEGASRAWFAGEGGMNNMSAKDITGSSVGGYNSKFSQYYNQYSGNKELTTPDISGNTKALTEQTAAANLSAQAMGLMGRELAEAQARITATTEANRLFTGVTEKDIEAKKEWINTDVQTKLRDFDDQLNKGIKIQDEKTRGVEKTTEAFKGGSAAMIEAAASAEAHTRSIQEGIPEAVAYRQILAEGAAQAAKGAAEQIASQGPVLTGMQKEAEQAKISGKAQHDIRIETEALVIVQKALDAETAKGTNGRKLNTEALLQNAKALLLDKEAAQNSLLTTQFLNKEKDAQQVLQLQLGLQGQTTEEINRQVTYLQEVQRLQRDTTGLLPQDKQLRLDAVDATQRMTVALAETNREQQRLESGIKSIADTIDSTIGKSITDMFDGKKIDDWGTKLKSMFSTISSSLVSSQITKPLIGTVLSGMGLTGLSSTFGTFGTSLFGTSSSSTASSGSITLTPSEDGKSFSVKTLGDAASAGKSVFDLFSTTSSVATEAPGFLSSAFSGSEFLFGTGLDFGGGGAAMGVADVLGGAEAIAGTSGLLGGLGSFSSAIPYIGPAIAVASMVLPMLFQKKPSNFAAGGNIDLSAGGTIGFKSNEGNSANTASANRIMDGISEFAADLIKETGGQLIGNLNVQAGSRDGIKIAGNIGSTNNLRTTESILSTEGIKFSSESEAIELTSLAMVKLIEGVSDTMATVLDSITDLDDLAEGIDFANTYDSLKDAFDSAFADVEPDIVGPYADALVEIGDIFDELTEGAEKFGLSLEPIDAGLTEANKRLLEDFNKEVADAILALEDPTESLIQIEKEAGKVRISDAIAVGADLAEVTRLNGLYLLEIANDGYRSIEDFNKEINDSILELTDPFKLLVEQEKELGQARLDEAIAIGASVVEVNRLNALTLDDIWETQVENLKDLRDELKSGSLSGLTVGEQVQAANDNFQTTLRLVRGGDLNEVENLVTRGQDALSLSEEAYGNAPETASLRNQILTSVDDVLASRSFAGGSESTPEGWIRVGENGPEWMKQSGGNKILPSGTSPGNDSGQLLSEVRKLNNLLEGGNLISREGFSQTIKRLEKVIGGVSKQTLSQPTRTKVA